MRRAHFDVDAQQETADEMRLRAAGASLHRHENIFRGHPDIVGYGLGVRNSEPYIIVFVRPGTGIEMGKAIPDIVDGFEVYYRETSPRAFAKRT